MYAGLSRATMIGASDRSTLEFRRHGNGEGPLLPHRRVNSGEQGRTLGILEILRECGIQWAGDVCRRGKQVKFAANAGRGQTKAALIVQSISSDIACGKLKERERLPAEDRLAARFRVSVGTIQKALGELARQRLIDREHGRGTFVAKTAGSPSELRYLRFCTRHGDDLQLYIHNHKVRTTRVNGPWTDFLGRARAFIHIQRQISVGGRFDIYSEFILRGDEFDGAADVKSSALERKSLREAFRQQFSLPTLRVVQHVGFDPLPARVAQLLGLPSEKGLVMELLGYTTNDRPFCYQRVFAGLFDDFLVVTR